MGTRVVDFSLEKKGKMVSESNGALGIARGLKTKYCQGIIVSRGKLTLSILKWYCSLLKRNSKKRSMRMTSLRVKTKYNFVMQKVDWNYLQA